MPPPHPTVIDEAMATSAIDESTNAMEATIECIRVNEEPTLTQLVEEGLDEAAEDNDEDPPA